jgi:uncharacterized protein YuzE
MAKRFNYDAQSDSLYICVKPGEEDSFEEIVPGINIELNESGEVIGVEILKASRFSDQLKQSSKV